MPHQILHRLAHNFLLLVGLRVGMHLYTQSRQQVPEQKAKRGI